MNMKKSLIAAAVTSACALPMAAQAEPVIWGEFIAGVQHQNEDARGVDGDGELALVLDSANFGIETEEDLGNGLSVTAGTEIGIDDGDALGGDAFESSIIADNTFAALSGDFGSVLLGWGVDSAYYLHVQEMVDHGEIYDTYNASGDTAYNAIQYGYDGGAFALTAEVMMGADAEDVTIPTIGGDELVVGVAPAEETENLDVMTIGATFDAGVVSIGAAHQAYSTSEGPEPSQTGISVGGGFGGVDIGAAYQAFDLDDDTDDRDPSQIDVTATTDFGGGLSGMLGVQSFDADTDNDEGNMTAINAQLMQNLSERTYVFGQLQSASIDGGNNDDVDPQRLFVGLGHAF